MNLFKRCSCGDDVRCDHPYWYRFWLHRREHRGSTHTPNRELANRIAIKRQNETLEDREKLRKLKPTKLSEHVKAYADWAEKTNRSSIRKDRRVLNHFVETIGDRLLDEVTAFHVERWKTLRAKDVMQSSVNRELNVIRGCFSRAVDWGLLIVSPMKTVKPYRVDNVRTRVLSPEEIKRVLETCPPALALIARTTLESLPRLSEVLNLRVETSGRTTRRSCKQRTARVAASHSHLSFAQNWSHTRTRRDSSSVRARTASRRGRRQSASPSVV